MRNSVIGGVILSLALFVAGCGGGLSADADKLGKEKTDLLNKQLVAFEAKKPEDAIKVGTELVANGTKIAALKKEEIEALNTKYKKDWDAVMAKIEAAKPK